MSRAKKHQWESLPILGSQWSSLATVNANEGSQQRGSNTFELQLLLHCFAGCGNVFPLPGCCCFCCCCIAGKWLCCGWVYSSRMLRRLIQSLTRRAADYNVSWSCSNVFGCTLSFSSQSSVFLLCIGFACASIVIVYLLYYCAFLWNLLAHRQRNR